MLRSFDRLRTGGAQHDIEIFLKRLKKFLT
jgi:hypothetical protein